MGRALSRPVERKKVRIMETMLFKGKSQEVCDSLYAAEYFELPHTRVVEEIETALKSGHWNNSYERLEKTGPNGELVYRMEATGFMRLAMGLPCRKAQAYMKECDRQMREMAILLRQFGIDPWSL